MKLKLSWLFDKFKYFNATPWDPIPFIKKVGFSIYQTREIDIPSDWSQLQKCLYHNFHLSALPSILRDFDLRSMRYGVEMRTPFLDYRLVNFCFSLPDTSKVDKGYSKIILREAMKGALPDVVRTRKQKVPFRNNQAKNSLSVGSRQWIEHTLEDKNPLEEFISTAEMKKFYYESVLSDSHTNNLSEKFCACLNAMRLLNIFKEKFDFS